ncbi:Protein CBG06487 [Caenorhabditis briggsae]|uniref:Serpentine receptor class gamma n=1 Tax=Caenorhabditis briggsae TaxID=6238 RepID=A8X2C3_CAEBR|nr:Protein CBG06487 [Caenorhabditis briggsae]CAP26783.1 Protein CBG06487 [Caenorhabditis briggsae]
MRIDIQCLRGLTISFFLIYHLFPLVFVNGYLGVDMFFVISGYLMARTLNHSKIHNISDILNRRFKRILPLYYLFCDEFFFLKTAQNVLNKIFIRKMDFENISPLIRTCDYRGQSSYCYIPLFVGQIVYALPCSMFYLYVILRIMKFGSQNVFSDIFFKLYALDGIVSLLVLVMDFGLTRPLIYVNAMCHVFWKLFPRPTYMLTPYLFLFNYFQFAKFFSIILLSANRFTSVIYPMRHKAFWKKYVKFAIMICILSPICFTWHLAIAPARFDPYVGEGIIGYESLVPFIHTRHFKLFVSSIAFIFLLLTNIKMYKFIKKYQSSMKSFEKSLAQSTVIMTSVFIFYMIVQTILIIFSTTFLVDHLFFGGILKKVECFCNDLFLLRKTKKLREKRLMPFDSASQKTYVSPKSSTSQVY